jgi:hypothetical protein
MRIRTGEHGARRQPVRAWHARGRDGCRPLPAQQRWDAAAGGGRPAVLRVGDPPSYYDGAGLVTSPRAVALDRWLVGWLVGWLLLYWCCFNGAVAQWRRYLRVRACVCFYVPSREEGTDDDAEAIDVPKRRSRRTKPLLACVRACVRACLCACVRACVHVCVGDARLAAVSDPHPLLVCGAV